MFSIKFPTPLQGTVHTWGPHLGTTYTENHPAAKEGNETNKKPLGRLGIKNVQPPNGRNVFGGFFRGWWMGWWQTCRLNEFSSEATIGFQRHLLFAVCFSGRVIKYYLFRRGVGTSRVVPKIIYHQETFSFRDFEDGNFDEWHPPNTHGFLLPDYPLNPILLRNG